MSQSGKAGKPKGKAEQKDEPTAVSNEELMKVIMELRAELKGTNERIDGMEQSLRAELKSTREQTEMMESTIEQRNTEQSAQLQELREYVDTKKADTDASVGTLQEQIIDNERIVLAQVQHSTDDLAKQIEDKALSKPKPSGDPPDRGKANSHSISRVNDQIEDLIHDDKAHNACQQSDYDEPHDYDEQINDQLPVRDKQHDDQITDNVMPSSHRCFQASEPTNDAASQASQPMSSLLPVPAMSLLLDIPAQPPWYPPDDHKAHNIATPLGSHCNCSHPQLPDHIDVNGTTVLYTDQVIATHAIVKQNAITPIIDVFTSNVLSERPPAKPPPTPPPAEPPPQHALWNPYTLLLAFGETTTPFQGVNMSDGQDSRHPMTNKTFFPFSLKHASRSPYHKSKLSHENAQHDHLTFSTRSLHNQVHTCDMSQCSLTGVITHTTGLMSQIDVTPPSSLVNNSQLEEHAHDIRMTRVDGRMTRVDGQTMLSTRGCRETHTCI